MPDNLSRTPLIALKNKKDPLDHRFLDGIFQSLSHYGNLKSYSFSWLGVPNRDQITLSFSGDEMNIQEIRGQSADQLKQTLTSYASPTPNTLGEGLLHRLRYWLYRLFTDVETRRELLVYAEASKECTRLSELPKDKLYKGIQNFRTWLIQEAIPSLSQSSKLRVSLQHIQSQIDNEFPRETEMSLVSKKAVDQHTPAYSNTEPLLTEPLVSTLADQSETSIIPILQEMMEQVTAMSKMVEELQKSAKDPDHFKQCMRQELQNWQTTTTSTRLTNKTDGLSTKMPTLQEMIEEVAAMRKMVEKLEKSAKDPRHSSQRMRQELQKRQITSTRLINKTDGLPTNMRKSIPGEEEMQWGKSGLKWQEPMMMPHRQAVYQCSFFHPDKQDEDSTVSSTPACSPIFGWELR